MKQIFDFGFWILDWRWNIRNLKSKIQNLKCAHVSLVLFLVACSALLWPTLTRACPGCKEALFDPGQLQQKLSTAKGYALSIALLLSVPLALIGGITALIIRARHRVR